jgi:hypothetical protein
MWIIDFGVDMLEIEASKYKGPFKYVEEHVKKQRDLSAKNWYNDEWWLHYAPRPAMRSAINKLPRYIGTPRVTKHRIFVFIDPHVLADAQLIVFARSDYYFFGVLHSKIHEIWSRATGTQLRESESGFQYTPTTTFETFPFPWPPGKEPDQDIRVQTIAETAKQLDEFRNAWHNPPAEEIGITISKKMFERRTLTNLYNALTTYPSFTRSSRVRRLRLGA